jgi:hypothetical protein
MRLSRRTFVFVLPTVAWALPPSFGAKVVERRTYGKGSGLPSPGLLVRNGICPASIRQTPLGTEYAIHFDSLEARVKAWDRFSSDPEWCDVRAAGAVQVVEIAIAG